MLQLLKQTSSTLAAFKPQRLLARLQYRLGGRAASRFSAQTLAQLIPRDENFRQLSFTFAIIALSARIACAAGPMSPAKYALFRDSFPLRGGLCGKIRSLFMLACEDITPLEHYVLQIREMFPNQQGLYVSLLERLHRIAGADGETSADADAMLSSMAATLEIGPSAYAAIRARHAQAAAQEALKVQKRASATALRKHYYELMRHYHPDTYAGETLSPEVELLLRLKSSEINQAYRKLTRRAA